MSFQHSEEDLILGPEEDDTVAESRMKTVSSRLFIVPSFNWQITLNLTRPFTADGDVNLQTASIRKQFSALSLIASSFPPLDQTLKDQEKAASFLNKHPQLRAKILGDWRIGFKGIRSLKILQQSVGLNSRPVSIHVSGEHEKAVMEAFSAQYMGSSATLLTSAIDHTFRMADESTYARAFTIIQSSGVGKSRAVDEVAKSRLTFPVCLREDPSTGYAFPLADEGARDYLTRVPGVPVEEREAAYKTTVTRFLGALFHQALGLIPASPTPYPDLAHPFHSYFADSNQRKTFYDAVLVKAAASSSTGFEAVVVAFRSFLTRCGDRRPLSDANCPVVICFDEVHTMTGVTIVGVKTAFDVLGSILANLKRQKFFVVFLSTSSKLSILVPPKALLQSHRPKNDPHITLPAPFTELGFDVHAEGMLNEDTFDRKSVSNFDFLMKFGRPLWATLFTSLRKTKMAQDSQDVVLRLARDKLVGLPEELQHDRPSYNARLAILSVRLLLDIEPAREIARKTEEELVSSHMRIAFSVPNHREFLRSGTPSEPLLAEAATHHMHDRKMRQDDGKLVLGTLNKFSQDGFSARGERGELVGRLLDILAIDNAINSLKEHDSLKYNTPVPVERAVGISLSASTRCILSTLKTVMATL